MMTIKQQMLACLRGEPTDRIPWVPRLDLWYRANKRLGTLPKRYQRSSLTELLDDLGWGFHAVIPDFQQIRTIDDTIDRGLGIYNLQTMCYRTVLEGIERKVRIDQDNTIVEYRTPAGSLRTVARLDESMRDAGITISHLEEPAFKTPADYAALGYIFEHARVEACYEQHHRFSEQIGERGLAVAFISLAASPMHLILRELMPFEMCCFEQVDHPDEMAALAEKIRVYYDRVLEVCANCPAEVFFFGSNFSTPLTSPPFFREHMLPWLKRFSDTLHQRGKFLLCHTDGENSGLLDLYLQAGIDIADSICPKPMTRLSLRETRQAFNGSITIMGGMPSVALLENSMSDSDFEVFLDEFFDELGDGTRQILGISDTTPPDADLKRLKQVAERVERFALQSTAPLL